jgi:hypothetical protein
MSADHDRELWNALVEAKREYNRRQADFYQNAQDRTRILKSALTGEPWQQATALSFLRAFAPDHADLLPQLVNLSLSHRWALAAQQAIDCIPRGRLWPALTPIIDVQLQTTDPDDLRRLAELLAHIQACPAEEPSQPRPRHRRSRSPRSRRRLHRQVRRAVPVSTPRIRPEPVTLWRHHAHVAANMCALRQLCDRT